MPKSTPEHLTDRQVQILKHLEAGLSPAQVAERVGLTVAGIQYHMRAIRKRGHTLPSERIDQNGGTAAVERADDQDSTIEDVVERGVEQAIADAEARIGLADQEIERLSAQMGEVETVKVRESLNLDRYRRALDVLKSNG